MTVLPLEGRPRSASSRARAELRPPSAQRVSPFRRVEPAAAGAPPRSEPAPAKPGEILGRRLVFRSGPIGGQSIELDVGRSVVIGRDKGSDLVLPDSALSRAHVRLTAHPGSVVVEDLGSTNGTYVNGRRVRWAALKLGDRVVAGATELELAEPESCVEAVADGHPDADECARETWITERYEADATGLLRAIHAEERSVLAELGDKRHRHLRSLIAVTGMLNAVDDAAKLFQGLVDTSRGLFSADRACLVLADGRGRYRKFHSVAPAVRRGQEWTLSTTILNESLAHGLSVRTVDAGSDDRFRGGDSVVVASIKSVMCVPVESGTEVLGALYLDTIGGLRSFDADDLELLAAIGKQAGFAVKRELAKEDRELLFVDTIRAVIASIEAKDRYTAGHSARVASYSESLGYALGHNAAFMGRVRYAAHLHDVGKIGVPEAILNKPAQLSADERRVIETHPTIGAMILANIRNIEDVILGVRHHHERIDGRGYPDQLEGEAIPLMSRIIAPCDTFDAMTSDRAYRKGLPVEAAIAELTRHSGSQFDPRIAAKLVDLVRDGRIVPLATPVAVP